jgi:hypothetical protein
LVLVTGVGIPYQVPTVSIPGAVQLEAHEALKTWTAAKGTESQNLAYGTSTDLNHGILESF